MPDDISSRSWRDAFAALPQEAPPTQAWERVGARLARDPKQIARKARSYAWIGLAAAAALAIVMLWPANQLSAPSVEPSHARLAAQPKTPPAGAAETTIVKPESRRKPEVPIAASAAPTKRRASGTAQRSMAPLYDLYAESAQLEALLSLARDERVSSAGAVLLAGELDAQVATVDAALGQPGLDADEHLRLWQARVDALRLAAGFESTQRLLASQGRGEMLLVSVD